MIGQVLPTVEWSSNHVFFLLICDIDSIFSTQTKELKHAQHHEMSVVFLPRLFKIYVEK